MTTTLDSLAERRAVRAEELAAFSGLKLLHIKRHVAEFLGQIGGQGIFDSYTRHDISHINEMLKSLDWLIPDSTKEAMTSADWLLTVLAIYFHDMGMLVTRQEFESRSESGFPAYRDNVLFAESAGTDYRAKVSTLSPEAAERFLYQEFVRAHHSERIRNWLSGKHAPRLGNAVQASLELDALLGILDKQFRQDLGMVCESHHLSDLSNLEKYSLSRPYGNTQEETANLQFCAILLRTADLLHMTRDRTPPIAFRVISPRDPISQMEWAKQMAVKSVRPKLGVNDDGELSSAAPKDTIEIHAFFEKPDGFFGLTSYLNYVGDQLKQNYDWLESAARVGASKHLLPWRKVDDSNVKTDGFLKNSFGFSLDNARILDLLTGHTLYDDTSVVLRELVQNSLDAVRVQQLADTSSSPGHVQILWNSARKELEVRDNGTGMTQQVIENNFLRAGSSRYQTQEFIQAFPEFSSISRFGIGILSTFMIADEVEVTTCHPEDDAVRRLTLRSVHGKYLVRLLDKETDAEAASLAPHGTSIRVRVRTSTPPIDIEQHASRWIVVPACKVTLRIDDGPEVRVGHNSPREALIDALRRCDVAVSQSTSDPTPREVRVIEESSDDLEIAYAVEWSEHFRAWSFLSKAAVLDRANYPRFPIVGTCIEGIRVEHACPGFESHSREGLICIANARGKNAPKTNVARSRLEATDEQRTMIARVYAAYCSHVQRELESLENQRSCSLSWAVREARYILSPLTGAHARTELENPGALIASARNLPLLVGEEDGKRFGISAAELNTRDEFWTVAAPFFSSAESLITEVESRASLGSIVGALDVAELALPSGLILSVTASNPLLDNYALADWEADKIRIEPKHRRVDLRWKKKLSGQSNWHALTYERLSGALADSLYRRAHVRRLELSIAPQGTALALRQGLVVAGDQVESEGFTTEAAVKTGELIYVLPHARIGMILRKWAMATQGSDDRNVALLAITLFYMAHAAISARSPTYGSDSRHHVDVDVELTSDEGATRDAVLHQCERLGADVSKLDFDAAEFGKLLAREHTQVFHPSSWQRSNAG